MESQDPPLQVGEDQWSGISDAQVRKRIQNRLAQRRHRRKIRELGTQEFVLETSNQVFMDPMQPVQPISAMDSMVDQHLAEQGPHSYPQICIPFSNGGVDLAAALPDSPCLLQPGNMSLDASVLAASTLPHVGSEQSSEGNMGTIPPSVLDNVSFPMSPGKPNNPQNIGHHATDVNDQSVYHSLPDGNGMPDWPRHDGIRGSQDDQSNRFHSVLVILKSLGFATVDDMVAQYYTAEFPDGSRAAQAQRFSRQRHLQRLLTQLHDASATWNHKDRSNYRDQILCAAEEFYQQDLHDLARKSSVYQGHLGPTTQELKRVLENQFPDLLSLFTAIATAVDIHSPHTCLDGLIRAITRTGTTYLTDGV